MTDAPKIEDGGAASTMTVRDVFAGFALIGLLSQHLTHKPGSEEGKGGSYTLEPVFHSEYTSDGAHDEDIIEAANQAYVVADSMLAARKSGGAA